MKFIDAAPLTGARMTRDGYMVADAKIARTGIQDYLGSEVGKPSMAVVRVYRPEEEVFHADALGSMAHRPVTLDHPTEAVSAQNWKRLSVGQTADQVARDGDHVRVPFALMDQTAIDAVKNGKRELSVGYECELDWTAGQTADGQAYDAVQRNIRGNHLAIVDAARAGPQCRIGDSWSIPDTKTDRSHKDKHMNLKTVTVDGIPVEVTDQGATVIATLQQRLADAGNKLTEATVEHAKALAAKDAELAKKDAALDDAKAKVLSDADIDKRVAARADLISTAKAIAADVKTDGLADADIRKAVVVAKLGDAAVKDKPQAYIDARFDILAEAATNDADPVRKALASQAAKVGDAADPAAAYAAMVKDMQTAHQPKAA